jgi:Hypothetical protein (DUF2513)
MKRDMDLIRQILLQTEEAPYYNAPPVEIKADGFSEEEISYHAMLLMQANYIEASRTIFRDRVMYKPTTLTWAGHEFLDAARNENIWNKAKTLITEKGGSMAVELLKTVLFELMKRQVLGSLPP